MDTFTCLEPQLGQLCFSLDGLLSSKKREPRLIYMSAVFEESKSRNFKVSWGVGRNWHKNHFCFILLVKGSHKTSPYWMCGWEIISTSRWEELQRRSVLDGEVKISCPWSVIAKGKCLLECLANLFQLSLPITLLLKNLRKQCFLCTAMKGFL